MADRVYQLNKSALVLFNANITSAVFANLKIPFVMNVTTSDENQDTHPQVFKRWMVKKSSKEGCIQIETVFDRSSDTICDVNLEFTTPVEGIKGQIRMSEGGLVLAKDLVSKTPCKYEFQEIGMRNQIFGCNMVWDDVVLVLWIPLSNTAFLETLGIKYIVPTDDKVVTTESIIKSVKIFSTRGYLTPEIRGKAVVDQSEFANNKKPYTLKEALVDPITLLSFSTWKQVLYPGYPC